MAAKMSDEQAQEVIDSYFNDELVSMYQIAKRYKLSYQTVQALVKGMTRKHLRRPENVSKVLEGRTRKLLRGMRTMVTPELANEIRTRVSAAGRYGAADRIAHVHNKDRLLIKRAMAGLKPLVDAVEQPLIAQDICKDIINSLYTKALNVTEAAKEYGVPRHVILSILSGSKERIEQNT